MYIVQVTYCNTSFLFNMKKKNKKNNKKNETPTKLTNGVFHLPSNQSKLVLLETILKRYHPKPNASRLSPSQDQSQIAQVVIPANQPSNAYWLHNIYHIIA